MVSCQNARYIEEYLQPKPMNNPLKLENQLCFPLYAAAKEVVRRYRPLLEPLGLTYTQYIAMMLLWEYGLMTISELGRRLYLDSGTLTPMLKKMELSGWITRSRSASDERKVIVKLTCDGEQLHQKALEVPQKMAQCVSLNGAEAEELYRLLYRLLGAFDEKKD